MTNRVALHFKALTEVVGSEEMGIIVLTDADEQRMLSVVCDKHTKYQLALRMQTFVKNERLLPEVLVQILRDYDVKNLVIGIFGLHDGEYLAEIEDTETLKSYPIRMSDAILLHLFSKMPILIDSGLMNRQSTPYKEDGKGVKIPLNILDTDRLEQAMKKAVETEDYRLASLIQDEIKKRKNEGN